MRATLGLAVALALLAGALPCEGRDAGGRVVNAPPSVLSMTYAHGVWRADVFDPNGAADVRLATFEVGGTAYSAALLPHAARPGHVTVIAAAPPGACVLRVGDAVALAGEGPFAEARAFAVQAWSPVVLLPAPHPPLPAL